MKDSTAQALIWLACSIVITTGIIVTGKLSPLWALLIPTLVSFSSSGEREKKQ
ncbi:hypothetical protein [Sediminibacillus massiliensis]|uniref:hypothetical protein n=1 Tax=Sediminibacillus massiliensis TaxID=1926277 RepID=UPI0015C37E4B|nr:hypothetical protein [Sediminibacillus massiliensis]